MMNIAVFIDADNVSPSHCGEAFALLETMGCIISCRAYGNWSAKNAIWRQLMNRYGVKMVHRYKLTRAKNASDIALVVDAMSSMYGAISYDALAIVSSDSDFAPLVTHAKACGKYTIGMGLRKTPDTYSGLCSEFLFLDEAKTDLPNNGAGWSKIGEISQLMSPSGLPEAAHKQLAELAKTAGGIDLRAENNQLWIKHRAAS